MSENRIVKVTCKFCGKPIEHEVKYTLGGSKGTVPTPKVEKISPVITCTNPDCGKKAMYSITLES